MSTPNLEEWSYLPMENCIRTRVNSNGKAQIQVVKRGIVMTPWISEKSAIDLLVAIGYVVIKPGDPRKEWEGEDDHY